MAKTLNKNEVIEIEAEHYMPVFTRQQIVIKRGKGAVVADIEGNTYIDCTAGIAVNSVGHCHPKVVQAIASQAETLIHTSNLYYTEIQAILSERMTNLTGMDWLYLTNSGSESNEAALKLARKTTGKKGFVSTENAFHGRTMGSLSVTWKEKFKKPFEPLIPGVKFVQYGQADAIREAVDKDTAAVIVEPIQGESGVIVPPEDYLTHIREICDEKDVLLIVDEVQTGFGRTGKWFGCHHSKIVPDIMTLAKAMGGGFPIGAMMSRENFAFSPSDHGGTQSGSPLACAAALATIDVIDDEGLVERSSKMGEYLKELLFEINTPLSREVRGKGLMVGYEIATSAPKVVNYAQQRGVLLNNTSENVLRFVPPLVIEKEQIDAAVSVVKDALDVHSR